MGTTWDDCKQFFGSLAIAVVLGAVVMTLVGCSGQPLSTREKATLLGSGIGAGTGAIVGAAVGHPLAGAAIGGGIGGATGFAVGNQLQNEEIALHHTQRQVASQQREVNHQRSAINQLKSDRETE